MLEQNSICLYFSAGVGIITRPAEISRKLLMYQEKDRAKEGRSGWVWPRRMSRLLAGALGLVFLTAAVMKATDLELFIIQIRAYDVISNHLLLTISAWVLIASECSLGVGLLIFYRPKLILFLTTILLLTFMGATGWASLTGSTEECGCFGAWLRRTPKEAAVESLILLTATLLAWKGHRGAGQREARAKAWAVASAFPLGLILPVAFGFPLSRITQSQPDTFAIELSQIQIGGVETVDLRHGTHIVFLMDTDCLHCQEMVAELNSLAQETDLPSVIALCMNDENQRRRFLEEFQPLFPIGQISEEDFFRLLADADIPRVLLVHEGQIRQVWDQSIPDKEAIKGQ